MGCCGGDDGGAGQARALEAERSQRIGTGMGQINQIFSGFDPEFYRKRQEAYQAFAMPQFGEQARTTQNQLLYGLADRGLLHSSAGEQAQSAFEREAARQQQAIVDAAFQQSQNLQKEVQGNKGQLISQLQASADPSSVAQQAISSAQSFSAPSVWQPIGNMFTNFANLYLANQIANAYKGSGQQSPFGGLNNFAGLGNPLQKGN